MPAIIRPGATSVPGNTERTVRLINWYDDDCVGVTKDGSAWPGKVESSIAPAALSPSVISRPSSITKSSLTLRSCSNLTMDVAPRMPPISSS